MTPSDTTGNPAVLASSSRNRGVRTNAFAVALLILLQYGLGMWVNLYETTPVSGRGKGPFAAFGAAVARGPLALTLHALVGTLLVVSAIALVIRAVVARKTAATVLSGVGLVAIISAWLAGASFVGSGKDGDSFGMAVSAAVALLCYVTILFRGDGASSSQPPIRS
jgi:heme A synthase